MSRHWLALSARSSLAPFLYQTPTLSASLLSRRATPSPFRSSYSTSKTSNPDEPAPTTESEDNAQNDPTIASSEGAGRRESVPRPRRSYLHRRAVSASPTSGSSKSSKTPSMTRGEKKVFSDLLAQIKTDKEHVPGPKEEEPTDTREEWQPSSKLTSEDRSEMAHISWIFDSVLKDVRKRNEKAEDPAYTSGQAFGAYDVQKAELDAMQQGLFESEYSSADISRLLNEEQLPMDQAIALVVQRELAKNETALQAAVEEGDHALWEVCKERIFSLVSLFEEVQSAATAAADTTSTTTTATPEPTTTPESTATPDSSTDSSSTALAEFLDLPPEVPAESVVGALYPRMLHAAFRLLSLHFPQSTLISQFRTTTKSQGRAYAVLGASTDLYNEMIHFYWHGCHDLPSVISLLQEMEVTGVEPDKRLMGQLGGIVRQRTYDLKRHWQWKRHDSRKRREPWWDLTPNRMAMRELIGENGWIEKLEKRLKEKKKKKEKNADWMEEVD